jgi:hypothetical protein
MSELTNEEITKIVDQYIGVSGGHLGDFGYRTLAEFFSQSCGLDVDPHQYAGTTRYRFVTILRTSPPDVQARILRGILERFPVDPDGLEMRTQALQDELRAIVERLEETSRVSGPGRGDYRRRR